MFRTRSRGNCRRLANMAAQVLTGKRQLHELVGSGFGRAASWLGAGGVSTTFVRELAAKIPLPTDTQSVAVARGLQVTGILFCVADNEDLSRCKCFVDLALAESKATVKKILTTAMDDWAGLAEFPPQAPGK